jgi:hypothetical protein
MRDLIIIRGGTASQAPNTTLGAKPLLSVFHTATADSVLSSHVRSTAYLVLSSLTLVKLAGCGPFTLRMANTGVDWDILSSYAGLLSLATVSIYAGSYGSLPVSYSSLIIVQLLTAFLKPYVQRTKDGKVVKSTDEEEEEEQPERLSSEDAWLFPVVRFLRLFAHSWSFLISHRLALLCSLVCI